MPVATVERPATKTDIGRIGHEDVDALASLLVSRRIEIDPAETAAFYATPDGQNMKAMLDSLRHDRRSKAV